SGWPLCTITWRASCCAPTCTTIPGRSTRPAGSWRISVRHGGKSNLRRDRAVMKKKGRGKPMVSGGDVIGAYQRIEARTSRMAVLAGEKDWESLISQEQDYVMSMAALAEMEADVELDDAQCRQKEQMLQRILAHNAATRRYLTE